MNLTESQLFTIEALNRIDGFVWPEDAEFAAHSSHGTYIGFHRYKPKLSDTVFDGYYMPGMSVITELPNQDWRNSLITREQFESVDGWVRDSGYPKAMNVEKVQQSSGGYKWRYHKQTKKTEMQSEPKKLTLLEILIRELPKRGGWPKDANIAVQYYDELWPSKPCILFGDGDSIDNLGLLHVVEVESTQLASDRKDKVVTKNEYLRAVLRENVSIQFIDDDDTKAESIDELYEKYQTTASSLIDAQMQVDYLKKQSEEALAEIKKWHQERGFSVSVIGADVSAHAHGGELNITDWRDLRIGDEIECVGDWEFEPTNGRVFTVAGLSTDDDDNKPIKIMVTGSRCPQTWGLDFKFIRRP